MKMEPQDRVTFGRYLRNLRERNGMTLREAGALADISFTHLGLIETGKRNPPSREVLERLAKGYKVDDSQLLAAAGYQIKDTTGMSFERLEWAFETVCRDPDFYHGSLIQNEPFARHIKAAFVELYMWQSGRNLLTTCEIIQVPSVIHNAVLPMSPLAGVWDLGRDEQSSENNELRETPEPLPGRRINVSRGR